MLPHHSLICCKQTCFVLLCFVVSVVHLSAAASDAGRCGFAATTVVSGLAQKSNNVQAEKRPDLPEYADSPTSTFRIHFTRTGVDAVPLEDIDGNGTPDFVDVAIEVLESALEQYIAAMNYEAPPSDGEAGGSSAIDVYLHDLSKAGAGGTGLYGNTIPDQRVASGPPERYTAWMEFDNDFSSTDRNLNGNPVYATHGTDALKVTGVHELHHVIQVGSYGVSYVQPMVYEFTSTWMEQYIYPEIPDWVTYSANVFTLPMGFPLSSSTGSNGYAWAFFNRPLYADLGNLFLQRMWVRIGQNEKPFTALTRACNDAGSTLQSVFCSNLKLFYNTGSRDKADDLLYFGHDLPEILLSVDQPAQPPSELISGSLQAFELRAYRFDVPATSGTENVSTAIIVTWPDEDAFQRADPAVQRTFTVTLTSSPLPTDVPVEGTSWGVRVEPADVCAWINSATSQEKMSPYPQPVRLAASREVFVPVPFARFQDQVEITVFTPEYVAKQSTTTEITLDDDRLVAPLHLGDDISPGIYIIQCMLDGKASLTKLVVQR